MNWFFHSFITIISQSTDKFSEKISQEELDFLNIRLYRGDNITESFSAKNFGNIGTGSILPKNREIA